MPDSQISRAEAREFLGVRPRFALCVGAVVLLAFLIREYFVLVTVVEIPIRGDTREYLVYAWNLYHHGIFSSASPAASIPIPDAYRFPGYPWLLALSIWLSPHGNGWYQLALQMQVVLGTATIWLTMLLARRWLNLGWAIASGVLLAVWPHHVAATGALLSEVLFGFTLMVGLYYFARAIESRHHGLLALASLAFGYAYLVNPLIALYPPLLALLIWREKARKASLFFVGVFLIPVLAFGLRNMTLDQSRVQASHAGRAAINLVQGSWPEYHHAWQAQHQGDPGGIQIMRQIDAEIGLLSGDPIRGLSLIAHRIRLDPGYYTRWYLWEKPVLLWAWEVRIGPGGVYVVDVKNSPLDTHPLLRWSTAILMTLNPLLTMLGLGGAVSLLIGGLRHATWAPAAALATAALAVYLTAVHTIFQAEPRYATAYRGIEILLIMTCLQNCWSMYRPGWSGNPVGAATGAESNGPLANADVT